MLSAGAAWATLAILVVAVYRTARTKSTAIFCSEADHELRLSRTLASLQSRPPGSKLSLHRRTLESNTIRNATHKSQPTYFPVDLSSFNHIIRIDAEAGYLICEPGISFGDLLRELLEVGMTTLVVPELPGITVGGAIAGGGLESSSHRHGQFSDTILEIECLTPELRVCSPQVDSDLFYAISASYNTCALMTKVKLKIAPAPNYVSLKAVRHHDFEAAVQDLKGDEGSDTIEGIAYSAKEILVVRGIYTSTPTSPIRHFTRHWDKWYYKTIRSNSEITIPYYDYCFRYNYGSFWMADYVFDMLGGDNLVTRFLIGPLLDTKHLFAVLHSGTLTDLGRMRVIQDCYIPVERAAEFLQAEDKEIGVYPIWLCPIKGTSTPQVLASHYSPTSEMFINVGLYGRPKIFPFDTRLIHSNLIDRLIDCGGRSMLYAQNWHTPDQFEKMYGTALKEVDTVRTKYGDSDCFFGLYEKVALSTRDRQELENPMMGTEAAETRKVVLDIVKTYLGW